MWFWDHYAARRRAPRRARRLAAARRRPRRPAARRRAHRRARRAARRGRGLRRAAEGRPACRSTSAATPARPTASSRCCCCPAASAASSRSSRRCRPAPSPRQAHASHRRLTPHHRRNETTTWPRPRRHRDLDAVVIGAGFAGHVHERTACATSWAWTSRCSRPATASAAPGTGTATRAPAATPSRYIYCFSFDEELDAGVGVERASTRRSRRSCATSTTSPTASTCAATSSSTPASRRRTSTRRPTAGRSRPTRATRSRRGSSSPPSAACRRRRCPTSRASRRSQGDWYHTGALAARGRRLHRQARRRHRHRLERRPVDPGDRRAGRRTSTCSSARRNYSMPGAQRHRSTQAFLRRRQGRLRRASARRARESLGGMPLRSRSERVGARRSSDEERERDLRGSAGSERRLQFLLSAFNDIAARPARPTTPRPSSSASKIREIVKRPGGRREARARSTTRSASSGRCIDTDYFETFNRDNVTLVDIRHAPIEEITPDGHRAPTDGEYELDVIVFATGFDAMTGALLTRSTSAGATASTLRDKWARRPAHLPRPRDRRLPEPVHDHRARAARRCSATCRCRSSSTSTGSRDCIDAPARRTGSTRSRPTHDAEDDVGRPRQRGRRRRRCSRCADSWYLGRQHPGQAARVHALPRRRRRLPRRMCDEVAANGYEGFALEASR